MKRNKLNLASVVQILIVMITMNNTMQIKTLLFSLTKIKLSVVSWVSKKSKTSLKIWWTRALNHLNNLKGRLAKKSPILEKDLISLKKKLKFCKMICKNQMRLRWNKKNLKWVAFQKMTKFSHLITYEEHAAQL